MKTRCQLPNSTMLDARVILKNMSRAYKLKRKEIFLGHELHHGEAGSNTYLRLAPRDAGIWKRPVHEVWDAAGVSRTLRNPLIHHSARSIEHFTSKINTYTSMNAQHLFESSVRTSWWHIIVYPSGKFLNNYILKMGFLDGTPGFLHAVFMSLHSFLTRGKLWLLWQSKKPSRYSTKKE